MNMSNGKSTMRSGLRLLWRRQPVLWWLFAVNLVAGFLASVPVRAQLGFLDRTLAADALYHGFDFPRLIEVFMKPEVNAAVAFSGSLGLALAYLVLAVFLTGGILETFYDDRRMTTGEFFRACGESLWRMARLTLLFAVALVPVLMTSSALRHWTQRLSDESPREQLGFWTFAASMIVLLLIALALRLWFDLAQVHAVAENQRAVRRSLVAAWRAPGFLRLYAAFVAIQACAFAVIAALFLLWLRVPPARVGLTLLLGELMAFTSLAARLWQRAAEAVFWQKLRPAEPAAAPVIAAETPAQAWEAPPAAV
jgi:hypothetical protein